MQDDAAQRDHDVSASPVSQMLALAETCAFLAGKERATSSSAPKASPLAKNDPLVLSRIDPGARVVIVRRRRTRSPQLCLATPLQATAVGL